MGKPAGNPRNGRRLNGVPKAGPLFVNGHRTPKGNVQAAVSKIYGSANRSLAHDDVPAQPGPMEILRGAEIGDASCAGCHQPIDHPRATRERATGLVWHMGTDCRAAAANE